MAILAKEKFQEYFFPTKTNVFSMPFQSYLALSSRKAYKVTLSQIDENLSVLLKVANNNEFVNVKRYLIVSKENYVLILEIFPWVSFKICFINFFIHLNLLKEKTVYVI